VYFFFHGLKLILGCKYTTKNPISKSILPIKDLERVGLMALKFMKKKKIWAIFVF